MPHHFPDVLKNNWSSQPAPGPGGQLMEEAGAHQQKVIQRQVLQDDRWGAEPLLSREMKTKYKFTLFLFRSICVQYIFNYNIFPSLVFDLCIYNTRTTPSM